MAAGELIVTDIGGGNPIPARADQIAASWLLSDPGTLTAVLPHEEARRLDLFGRGAWVYWTDPDAGDWGGVVGNLRWSGYGLELPARGFGSLLGDRLVPRTYVSEHVPPGAHIRRLIRTIQESTGPMLLTRLDVDEGGAPMDLEGRLEDLLIDVLPDMLVQGHEWRVTSERVLEFRQRIGYDRTAGPALVEGKHILSDWAVTEHREDIVNHLTAVGGPSVGWKGTEVTMDHAASMAAWGIREGVRVYDRWVTRKVRRIVRQRLRKQLREAVDPVMMAEFSLNREDSCWRWFAEGDTVRVLLPTAGLDVAVRVGARSVTGDIMYVAGEVVP